MYVQQHPYRQSHLHAPNKARAKGHPTVERLMSKESFLLSAVFSAQVRVPEIPPPEGCGLCHGHSLTLLPSELGKHFPSPQSERE